MAARSLHKRHKYHRTNDLWSCGLPNCTHYMPKNVEHMVNGRSSYCWSCNAEITLNPANMAESHPRCDNCRLGIELNEPEAPIPPSLAAFLNGKS